MDFSAIKDLYIGSTPVQSAWMNGSKVWGRKPAVDEQSIRDAMILWYDLKKQGSTNENMAENPVLRDLSGNGYDAICYNFAWSGMSGIDGYSVDYTQYKKYAKVEVTNHTIIATTTEGGIQYNWLVYFDAVNTEAPSYDIKVSGLTKSKPITYRYVDENSDIQNMSITEDGIYTLPKSYLYTKSDNETNCGFQMLNGRTEHVVIEQLPLYPNALVSDGVDDYCLVEGLPILTDFTVFTKRRYISMVFNSALLSKRDDVNFGGHGDNAGAFQLERNNSEGIAIFSFGVGNKIAIQQQEDIVYLTANSYNGNPINKGDATDTSTLNIFNFGSGNHSPCSNVALYSVILFNRTLTPEEIEWVKTNLIETEQ